MSVEVDGAATSWELADPLAEARQVRRHDVIGLEAWLRASMCASSQGELAVYLPESRQNEAHVVTITYQLDCECKGQAGVTFFGDGNSKGVRSVHRLLGSALASADFDAVRCWMPCVDAEPVRHPWRLDFGVVGATNLLIAASGSRVMLDVDPFFQEQADRASFVVNSCVPARAIGFVVLGAGYDVIVKPVLAVHHLGRSKKVTKKSDAEGSSQPALHRTESTSSVMTHARRRLESSNSMSCFPNLTRVESMNLSGPPGSPQARAHSNSRLKNPSSANFDPTAQLTRRDSHRDDLAAPTNHNRQHHTGHIGCDKLTVECIYPQHMLQRTGASEVAAVFADVVQFWHSWFSTTDASSGGASAKKKCHSIGCVSEAVDTENDLASFRGSSAHFVVLVENLDVPFVPCAGLVVVDARTAKRATQHYDSLTRASSAETVVTSIVSSLTLKEIAVRDADSDEWVIHALVGAIVSRFVDRAQNRLRERLVRLTQATIAREGDVTRRPLSLVSQDDPPSWWRALEARSSTNWLGAKAALVAHALEARLGRSTVRRAACRLRDLCCRKTIAIFDPSGFHLPPFDEKGLFLISTSRFLRACALEPLATQRGLAAKVGNLDDLEATDDQIALTIDESVAEFRQRWIESTGCSILECEYAFDTVKQMLELNVEQRVDDDRSFAEAAKLPICVRVVGRDDTRDYYKFLDGFFHKWIFKSSFSTGAVSSTTLGTQQDNADKAHVDGARGPTPPPVASGEGDGAAGGFGNGPAHDDEAVSVDSVMAVARGLNRSPLLYMRLDPDFKLIRRVDMRQAEHAWIEQLFGDDDIGAQLEAVGALSQSVKLPTKSMADKMLAARALACVLRGVDHSIAVRCASANALAEWQRSESASSGSFSTFAASQLWRAFDERFKGPDGLLRPADFQRSHDGSDDQLALKTALAGAFGGLSDPEDRRQWTEAAERCLELLRDHVEPSTYDEDTSASERLSNEVYVETVLASLAKVAAKGDDAWLVSAISQARRFLEWHLMIDRNDAVAAAALATLYNLLAEQDHRDMRNQQELVQNDDDKDDAHLSKIYLPDSAPSLLRKYRHNTRIPELVRTVALKLDSPGKDMSRFSACDFGLAQQYFQSPCSQTKASEKADVIWKQLSSTYAVAFNQQWRVQLLEFYHTLQHDHSEESQQLPEPLLPILRQVISDKGKRIAPKRQRYVRDLDVTNPLVLKKIKINFTASSAVATSRKTTTPPPQVPLPAASSHDTPTPAMAATGEAPLDSSAIRPIAIRPSKPIVLARS